MFSYNNPPILTDEEISIFPIVTYNPDTKIWKCLGTGFFVHHRGTFITAKHLFIEDGVLQEPTLYGIQTTKRNEKHFRPVDQLVYHPDADIMVGRLGNRRLRFGIEVAPTDTPSFYVSNMKLNNGDQIKTFAYPKSVTIKQTNGAIIGFKGTWSSGEIIDFYEQGSPLVKNRCYQTTMHIDGGASGGPVIKDDIVVGLNSSSYNLMEGEDPISFITPIDYLPDIIEKKMGIQLLSKTAKSKKDY